MLRSVIHAIGIGILEICYVMIEFIFLHFSIEALVIIFYKKIDCYEKLFRFISKYSRNRNLVIHVSFNQSSLDVLFDYKVCSGF